MKGKKNVSGLKALILFCAEKVNKGINMCGIVSLLCLFNFLRLCTTESRGFILRNQGKIRHKEKRVFIFLTSLQIDFF
jgi:hypothetical protein